MRCFKFRVRSKKGDRRFAHVWVNEKELDKAEGIARTLLGKQGWIIENIELSMLPTPYEIAHLDRAQAFAYKRALSDGSYAHFTDGTPTTP